MDIYKPFISKYNRFFHSLSKSFKLRLWIYAQREITHLQIQTILQMLLPSVNLC